MTRQKVLINAQEIMLNSACRFFARPGDMLNLRFFSIMKRTREITDNDVPYPEPFCHASFDIFTKKFNDRAQLFGG